MTASRKTTVIAGTLLAIGLGASVMLVRALDRIRTHATLEEILYVPSPKILKKLSLGYNGLMADIYWTRAVQYFGGHHAAGAQQYKLLGPLLEITTALDPKLTVAYEYGANFLTAKPPNGAGDPQKAIEILEFGIKNNPNEWRLYYNMGFVYYMELHDYANAAEAFARGAQVTGAHPFLGVLAANMAAHAGDVQMARMMWTTTYQSTSDRHIRANAMAHLRALRVDEDVPRLEKIVEHYTEKNGNAPQTFRDLIVAGLLQNVPLDPLGNPYRLAPDGRVEVRDPDSFPFIKRGVPPDYVPPAKIKFLPTD